MQHFHANGLAMPKKKDWTSQIGVYPARHIHNTFLQDPINEIVTTRTGSGAKRHTNLNIQKEEDSSRLPSATVRQVVGVPPRNPRDLSDTCSGALREVFEYCSGISEAHPNNTRRNAEGVPNKSRSGLEERPKETRTASEEIDGFLPRFIDTLKAGIKYRCSKDIVLFTQLLRKIDGVSLKYIFRTSGVQYPYLFSRTTTQQQPKDDPSASLARPSLRTGYRQGSPKVDARKTQETANNDTRNVRLMYCECTVSVLGVYGKGTKEVLRRYWRATKDILNGCTSGLDQRYSKSRRGVEAMKNKVVFSYGLLCFMLFNLSDAWAQSAETRTAEGQTEIKPLQVGDTIPEELWNLPLQVVNHPKSKDTITLNDYRDKKLIILDFWATWCGSCIAAFPKLYEIKDEFQDIAFIANSAENADKVKGFVQAKQRPTADLMPFTVSNDLDLFFPHRFLPHYIWIKEGVYLGATDSKTVNLEKVSAVRSSIQPVLQNLKDDHVTFDRWKFYANDPQLLSHVEYGSTILRHVPGINSLAGVHIDSVSGTKRYYYNNSTLYQLYRAAAPIEKVENVFVPPAARIYLYNVENNANPEEGTDSLYCYEQVLPAGYSDEDRRSRMRSDLDRYFDFQSRVIRVETDILTIEGIPVDSKEGISLDKVVRRFNRLLRLQVGDDIVQVSGNGGVLVPASFLQIDTADAVLKMLKRYGFHIKPEKRYVEVLIIDKTN